MATMTVKGTSIIVTCNNTEDLFTAYNAFAYNRTCVVNGEELKPMGNGCGGYTRNYFDKFFN